MIRHNLNWRRRYALLPVRTRDFGWVWLECYWSWGRGCKRENWFFATARIKQQYEKATAGRLTG